MPHDDHYEFGFRRGNEHHFTEKYEKAAPHQGHFKTKVRSSQSVTISLTPYNNYGIISTWQTNLYQTNIKCKYRDNIAL